jgi:hypothetical protein
MLNTKRSCFGGGVNLQLLSIHPMERNSHMATKIQLIKDHFRSGRSLTQLEAIGLYGAFRLAARVKELRDRGWNITTDMREDPNGNPYACYTLEDSPTHGLPAFARPESHAGSYS